MNRPRTKLELYGRPKGNEFVYGKEIIRPIGLFDYDTIDIFQTHKEANAAFEDWITESGELDFADGEKVWSHSRPIIGMGENGQPMIYDSWGEKK